MLQFKLSGKKFYAASIKNMKLRLQKLQSKKKQAYKLKTNQQPGNTD